MPSTPNVPPASIRVLVVRALTYRGRTETYQSLASLFQGLCGRLQETGALQKVYGALATVKQRILNHGQPLTLDDVIHVTRAHQAAWGQLDPLVLSEPRFILSVPGTGERMAYHRELVNNLKATQQTQLILGEESLVETLAVVLHPRHFSSQELQSILGLNFSQQEGLGVLRVLDTLYKATFSRTIRKDLCDPKIVFPLPENAYQIFVDQNKTAHVTLTVVELLRHLLYRLYQTPDLATLVDNDDRIRTRIHDGLRLLSGALHDLAVLPQKRQEVEAILRDRKTDQDGTLEDLEEL